MTQRTLRLSDGATVTALDVGQGEPLLLIHGVGMNARAWAPQIADLARDWRVILFPAWLIVIHTLVITLPLWWLPFVAFILPPLIWGWMTYRVMAYDVLADHATKLERIELMTRYRFQLLGIGVVTGMMGAAPSVIWASGALFAAAFVILIPIAVWIYTLVFIFSSLWFAHMLMQALEELRQEIIL